MSAGIYKATCEQGATWNLGVVPHNSAGGTINLSGYTARMMVRESIASSGTILSLSSPSSGLSLASGTISATVSATVTGSLTAGLYVYDLEMESGGGEVTRLIRGPFLVPGEVTR
jgi:hypothetical protein